MSKKKWIALAVLAALILGGAAGIYLYNTTYITVCGQRFRRDSAQIDLQGAALTAGDYEALRAELPECEILWNPLFQGTQYPTDTTKFTVSTLTVEDLDMLSYFPGLTAIDASGCEDYEKILALQTRYPDCDVRYSVTIGDREYRPEADFARLPDADVAEVTEKLKFLPGLKSVLFTGKVPSLEEIQTVADAYPDLTVNWQVELYGMVLDSASAVLDLTDIPLKSSADVEAVLPYLPGVQTINLCGTGLADESIMALAATNPEIEFIWNITIGQTTFRSDDVEIDISGNKMTAEAIEAWLPYLTRVEKIIMSNCGIDNETMDALNRRHEDIQFVWTVELGPIVKVRTDITSFIPFKYCVDFYQEDLYNLRYCTELIALDLGHQKVYSCEFVAFMPKLKYLVLADTLVQDLTPLTGLTNLVYLEIFVTYLQDYEPLLTLTGLRDLNLSWTYGDYEIIAQMPWLERCWWGGHWHNWQVRQYLQEKCPNTRFEFDDPESTGSGWRTSKYYYEMRDALGMFYMQ